MTTALWIIPADSNVLADSISAGGYFGMYSEHCAPAIKAAAKHEEQVTDLIERFPGSLYGRTIEANLMDFVNWKGVGAWATAIKRITMPNLRTGEHLTYVAYLRPPSDLRGDKWAWRAVLDHVKHAKCKVAIELAPDRFSLDCYAELKSLGILYAIEPGWEVGLPELWDVPIITAQLHLERLGAWPANWRPLGTGQPRRFLIATDEPWTPQWSRLASACGYSPVVMPHRFAAAAELRVT
jgi:hypothetical protein